MRSLNVRGCLAALVLTIAALPAVADNPAVSITVDPTLNQHPISPLIYGVAFGNTTIDSALNVTLDRSGGNNETRYNWQLNAINIDNDYFFESFPAGPGSSAAPSAAADAFINAAKAGGSEPMITIPMIGWAAKLGPNRSVLWSFSVDKYGPQTQTDPFRGDAGNGISTAPGNPFIENDPNDADVPVGVDFQSQWLAHLVGTFGPSTSGGVKYYLMDNEPSIWFSTHRDVHPVGPTMDEIRDGILNYGGAVKAADPNAAVCAPEEWGWNGYFWSGFDQQYAPNVGYNTSLFPDRQAHGGMDYIPYLLQQVAAHDSLTGKRTLDYLTVHCYPQGFDAFSGGTDAATETLRNQETREFWDPNYVDPSWINSKVDLIPRMKNWVNTYYPGTKIGITEYNWGLDNSSDMNGGTAQADLLGIFGREGLDMATRWVAPNPGTTQYNAFRMYRNYDGAKSTFGDVSVSAIGPNPDTVSTFAATRSADGMLTVMVIAKSLTGNTPATVNLANFAAGGPAQVYQLANNVINQLADAPVVNSAVTLSLPPKSVTLLVVPSKAAFLTSLDPALVGQGNGGFTLKVLGRNLASDMAVTWNGDSLPTTFVSSGELDAQVPAGDVAAAGDAAVTATSPETGALNTLTVHVVPPPVISALSPSSAPAGAGALTLLVDGTGFAPGASVRWNGIPLPTTFLFSTLLTTVVPASDLATAGQVSVTVANTPFDVSAPATFSVVNNNTPVIASIDPTAALVGSGPVTLTVNGTGFDSASTVKWNAAALATTFVSDIKLTAVIPAADLATATTAQITVTNGNGKTSTGASFKVAAVLPPVLTSLSPSTLPVGSPAFTLTVDGSNFTASSVVVWGGTNLSTTVVSPTELTAQVPASSVAVAGTVEVAVADNGVNSDPLPFMVAGVHTFPAGLQLMSTPVDYGDQSIGAIFDVAPLTFAVWNPSSLQYALTPTAPADAIRQGVGYWVRFPRTTNLVKTGTDLGAGKSTFAIHLTAGWNMIGTPSSSAVPLSGLMVVDSSGTSHTLADANAMNILSSTLYSYDQASGQYSTAVTSLTPYTGYWILANQSCTLQVPLTH